MNTFLISDTHFGHRNIITFQNDGKPLRPFSSVEEMDETMVKNWNGVVKPKDTVYHLGDVVINRKALSTLDRLNGRKILIKGNHDIFKLQDYIKYFEDIRAYKVLPHHGIICSHIPIHPDSMYRWKLNIHGHLHGNTVKQTLKLYYCTDKGLQTYASEDSRYMCVSVEQINYTPISLDTILKNLEHTISIKEEL